MQNVLHYFFNSCNFWCISIDCKREVKFINEQGNLSIQLIKNLFYLFWFFIDRWNASIAFNSFISRLQIQTINLLINKGNFLSSLQVKTSLQVGSLLLIWKWVPKWRWFWLDSSSKFHYWQLYNLCIIFMLITSVRFSWNFW